MAKCAISGKECRIYQYVVISEAPGHDKQGKPEPGRKVFVRFDESHRAHEVVGEDWRGPLTVRWNPGRRAYGEVTLEEHRALADSPGLTHLPGVVRAKVSRAQLKSKMSQFAKVRERLLNP